MKVFFVTDHNLNLNFDFIDWRNTSCISRNLNSAKQARDEWHPDGLILEIDMDDDDVVNAVFQCMLGNSCRVKVKILRVVRETTELKIAPAIEALEKTFA